MAELQYDGGCLCGDIRYRIKGVVKYRCNCHCQSCRRASGAPYVAWGTIDLDDLEFTSGELAFVQSSPGVERGFCGSCGASVTFTQTRRPGEIDFTLATLDDPGRLAPQAHIWLRDKLPWVQIGDDLPRYQGLVNTDDPTS